MHVRQVFHHVQRIETLGSDLKPLGAGIAKCGWLTATRERPMLIAFLSDPDVHEFRAYAWDRYSSLSVIHRPRTRQLRRVWT